MQFPFGENPRPPVSEVPPAESEEDLETVEGMMKFLREKHIESDQYAGMSDEELRPIAEKKMVALERSKASFDYDPRRDRYKD